MFSRTVAENRNGVVVDERDLAAQRLGSTSRTSAPSTRTRPP
jgi:hypothetical protein